MLEVDLPAKVGVQYIREDIMDSCLEDIKFMLGGYQG